MVRIVFYIVLLVISFSILMYSLYQRSFIIDPAHPGFIRLLVQGLVFVGIVIAFISVIKAYRENIKNKPD